MPHLCRNTQLSIPHTNTIDCNENLHLFSGFPEGDMLVVPNFDNRTHITNYSSIKIHIKELFPASEKVDIRVAIQIQWAPSEWLLLATHIASETITNGDT